MFGQAKDVRSPRIVSETGSGGGLAIHLCCLAVAVSAGDLDWTTASRIRLAAR